MDQATDLKTLTVVELKQELTQRQLAVDVSVHMLTRPSLGRRRRSGHHSTEKDPSVIGAGTG